MKKLIVALLIVIVGSSIASTDLKAQCAMCTAISNTANQEDEKKLKGLNDGILYLLAMPYLAVAGVGFLWYRKSKKISPKELYQ